MAFCKEEVAAIIENLVELTRFYMGKKSSAPYARAAKDICSQYGLPVSDKYDWLISRGRCPRTKGGE